MRMQAFSWCLLLSLIQISCDLRVSGQCLDDQRQLLLQLKDGLEYNSSSSTKLVNWRDGADCCSWDGVDCDHSSGHVTSLDLQNESISGGIDNSTGLFGLQYLERLNLASNIFNGTLIPKGLQNLTNLAYLNLSDAGFGGQVPIEVGAMRRLVVLDLSSLFQAVRPLRLEDPNLQMLVQNFTGLRELHLDYVNISARGSECGQALSSSLPNLAILSLRYCGLSGPLDPSLSRLRSLSVLRIEGNILATMVPDFFGKFSNLTSLILSNCFLEGTFPELVFQVSTLQTLDLSNNTQLNGTIKEFRVNSSLRTMVLRYTSFTGSLPDSISNLKMLSKIDLSNCNFTGAIPSSIANLKELVFLDFSYNSFTGSIPLFHMSKNLTFLDLSHNSLTCLLSSKHFENLSSLVNINLRHNLLNGSIPLSLFGLPFLQTLLLSENKFSGKIDEFPISNSSLNTLDLSGNHLEGPIPASVFKLEGLSILSLSSNFFNGTIEMAIFQSLRNLTKLELGSNNISIDMSSRNSSFSQFPQLSSLNLASCNLSHFPDLRNQSGLAFLDLSNNHIEGEIPNWIWNIGKYLNLSHNFLVDLQKPFVMPPMLTVLDLHSNNLSGEFPMPPPSAIYVDYSSNNFQQPIPDTIGNFISFAYFFSLANNSFNGTITASICNAIYLQVLDLSANKLSGNIPPCLLGNIPDLGVLNLGRNNIRGDIPDAFSVNCSLKTLDLCYNNLGGTTPLSLANCKTLEVLNLGNNKIHDTFPCQLKNSSDLRVLVLRNNTFHGDLQCSGFNGSWPNLQIIDIASNSFRGELSPGFIASWKGMVLDDDDDKHGNHLGFVSSDLQFFYYQDTVTVTNKGLPMRLFKILTVFTVIDFSSNNFTGEIPQTLGALFSLYVLNFSHNSFTGTIPRSLGNLKQLGSLDLSANQLTGGIPQSLLNLTFLSVLNLSYNKLNGRIPSGSQFSTFSPESYVGNTGLCGLPLNTRCESDPNSTESAPASNSMDSVWTFVFAGWGYVVGLTSFYASLLFCNKWRELLSKQLDGVLDLIYPGY